ncbi:P-loop NTPase fold protein [Brevibacillus invocatus]|uniref:P-loop NTPase fold protein n=1 Tax=Brevibacillus invocatus TaxID=173959 RepID=UPI00203F1E8D|nr:P-loop NTPase fold protein [Brevibacillus invocatus]MCM3080555.1 KAP family NTPase [Brevibacillus invocatus]MCM3430682.1 KAP family NTPase [Brevibacillus invocatus]
MPAEKHYLEDQPVTEHKSDRFQFAQISELMYQLLEQGHLPLHIGLLGPWGSGKTSILRLLEKRIEIDGGKYDIKFISVWKFSEDAHSLQRKIVREVEHVLDLNNPEGISSESTRTTSVQGTNIGALFIPSKQYFKENKAFSTAVVLFLLLVLTTPVLSMFFTLSSTFFLSLNTVYILAFFGAITSLLNKSSVQRTNQIQVKELALQHGDQYEHRFNGAVEEYLKKKKNKKLIFVFDDLDRLPPKQLVAALNTIKTFLRSDSCAFIIPCDEKVLRSGIKKVFEEKKMTNFSVSEYLNKTFDHLIHLPVLEQANMKKYAKRLLLDQNVNWTKDSRLSVDRILGNIIHSNIKTPRQVKNILNAFAYDWALACKRDEEAGVELLTSNPMSISVFSVLKTNFPNFFEKLKETPFLIKEDLEEKRKTRGNDDEKVADEESNESEKSEDSPHENLEEEEDHLDETLIAFLARVKNSIPDDPRPFIYFTNEKLNPAAGKPDIQRAKDALMNDQPELFDELFQKLSDKDKPVVLESTLSDIEDNASVEIENCLSVLIQTKRALNYITELDRIRWEHLVQTNLMYLTRFPIDSVCYALEFIGPYTWKDYGRIIDKDTRYKELVNVWMEHPNYIEKLSIPELSTSLVKTFSSNEQIYDLLDTIRSVDSNNSLLTSFDWWSILLEAAKKKWKPSFTFKDWLEAWQQKSGNDLTCSSIGYLYKAYGLKKEAPLQGFGELWCTAFDKDGTEDDLLELLTVFKADYYGFTEGDLRQIGSYLKEYRESEELKQKVITFLKAWWEEEDDEDQGKFKDIAHDFLTYWGEAPGIPEFCLQAFQLSLEEKYLNTFIEILIRRADEVEEDETLMETLFGRVRNSSGKTEASKIILTLGSASIWRQKAKKYVDEVVMHAHINTILSWGTDALRERVELLFKLKDHDTTTLEWMENTIFTLTRMARGIEHTPLGNPSITLNTIVESGAGLIQFTNWDQVLEKWISAGIRDVLQAQNQDKVLQAFLRHCAVENKLINQWLVESQKVKGVFYQDAIFARWEYFSSEDRKQILGNMMTHEDKTLTEQYQSRLVKWYNDIPFLAHIEELASWPFSNESKQSICNSIIKSVDKYTLGTWLSEEIAYMNQNGKNLWKQFAVEEATKLRLDLELPDDITILETAIGIGDERAQLALQVIASAKVDKGKIQKLRGKILRLSEHYPDEVSEVKNKYHWRMK